MYSLLFFITRKFSYVYKLFSNLFGIFLKSFPIIFQKCSSPSCFFFFLKKNILGAKFVLSKIYFLWSISFFISFCCFIILYLSSCLITFMFLLNKHSMKHLWKFSPVYLVYIIFQNRFVCLSLSLSFCLHWILKQLKCDIISFHPKFHGCLAIPSFC